MRIFSAICVAAMMVACNDKSTAVEPNTDSKTTSTCVEGEKSCHGTFLTECRDNVGVHLEDCAGVSGTCEIDEMGIPGCVPLSLGDCALTNTPETYCSGLQRVEACIGGRRYLVEDCEADILCKQWNDPAVAFCDADTCDAIGSTRCRGDVVELCDGSSWIDTVDCAATALNCEESGLGATCSVVDTSCEAGAFRCDEGRAEACLSGDWTTAIDCTESAQVCDLDSGGFPNCVSPDGCSNDDYQCSGDVLERCESGQWEFIENCSAAAGGICQDTPMAQAFCDIQEMAGFFEECGSSVGTTCQAPLSCSDEFNGVCYEPCSTTAECSNPGDFCLASTGCWPKSDLDEPCVTVDGCLDSGAECLPTHQGLSRACRLRCSADDLESQGSCPAGLLCLDSNRDEFEVDAQGQVRPCDGSGNFCGVGYQCDDVSLLCVQNLNLCGEAAEIVSNVDDDYLALEGATLSCSLPGEAKFCPAGPSDAPTECINSGWTAHLGQGDDRIACTTDRDCSFWGGACLPFVDGDFCGVSLHVCLTFCESDAGAPLDCPAGQNCVVPETAFYTIFENGASALLTCGEDSDCDTSAGFACEAFGEAGQYCARSRRLCVDNEE